MEVHEGELNFICFKTRFNSILDTCKQLFWNWSPALAWSYTTNLENGYQYILTQFEFNEWDNLANDLMEDWHSICRIEYERKEGELRNQQIAMIRNLQWLHNNMNLNFHIDDDMLSIAETDTSQH